MPEAAIHRMGMNERLAGLVDAGDDHIVVEPAIPFKIVTDHIPRGQIFRPSHLRHLPGRSAMP